MDRLAKFEEIFDEYYSRDTRGYEAFAAALSVLAQKEGRPWQKTFIYNLLNRATGYSIGDQMWGALLAFEKERHLALRLCTVASVYAVPLGAVACAKPRQCTWCNEWLIPDHPNRKYCPHNRCRLDARNERRRQGLV